MKRLASGALLVQVLLSSCAEPEVAQSRAVQLIVEVCSPHPVARGYPEMISQLFGTARGVDVTLAPITHHSYTEQVKRVQFPPEDPQGNPLVYRRQLRQANQDLVGIVREWQVRCAGKRQGAEILAAVKAAGERLPPSGGTLVIVSSGFEQTASLNLYDQRFPPVGALLEAAKAGGWSAKLSNVRVCFVGVNNGDGQTDSRLTARVAEFWGAWIEQQGGTLTGYGHADCDLTAS